MLYSIHRYRLHAVFNKMIYQGHFLGNALYYCYQGIIHSPSLRMINLVLPDLKAEKFASVLLELLLPLHSHPDTAVA